MSNNPEISVVIPVFNEDSLLKELSARLIQVLESHQRSFEIIFVNDGSSDASLTRLIEIRQQEPRVKILELSRNYGQTAALAAGIDQAKGSIIITMDGDLQHEPEQIPRFLEKLDENYDIVNGWREVRTDHVLLRRLPSACANWLMRKLSGIEVRDFGSTFKAYRAEVLKQVEMFGEMHRFVPVLAARFGARIIEIPITVHPRKGGESKYGIGRTFGVFQDLIFLEFYTHYLTKPLRIFGKLALLFFGAGFLASSYLMLLWLFGYISGVWERGALLLFSVFLMIIGVQFFVVGILAELLTRIYHHTSKTKIYSVRKAYSDD